MKAQDTAMAGGKPPHDTLTLIEHAIIHVSLALAYLDDGNILAVRTCLTDAQTELSELAKEQ